jgi:hypothetical protein
MSVKSSVTFPTHAKTPAIIRRTAIIIERSIGYDF